MKKILSIAAVLLCVSAWGGSVERQVLTATSGTVATSLVTQSTSRIDGYLDQIDIVVTAGKTGTVWMVLDSGVSGVADVTLVAKTNANTSLVYRPRFDGTDTAGAALSSDPPARLAIAPGDAIVLSVSNASAASAEFKAAITYEYK